MHKVQDVRWRNGFRAKVDAETAFTEIEEIRQENGGKVVSQDVVDRAKPRTNPLHPQFLWDNRKAGAEYRKEQARGMLRSLEVVYQEAPAAGHTRFLEVVTERRPNEDPRKVYQTTAEILEDPIARDELLGRAICDALAFKRRYAMLSELAGVFHALDEMLQTSDP